jgi:glycosyltransferase involved in cell wall biosynthesis
MISGMQPVVSVVIIFLDEERFLAEAVESVLGQTYRSWEVVLVDDGSTDASTRIARAYAGKYPDAIRYVEHDGHENRGMSASRNLGIARAHGRYVAILDADDVWVPTTLEEQVAILDSHPEAAMVYGRVQRWYSWTGDADDRHRDSMRELVVPPDRVVAPPTLCPLLIQDRGVPSGILVRREVAEEVGGFEAKFRGMYEDNAFLFKVCLRHAVFASGRSWYRYRKREDSSCANVVRSGGYPATRLAFLAWADDYVSAQGVENLDIRRALRDERRRSRRGVLPALRHRIRRLLRRDVPTPDVR